jgi:hypothetical protein
VDESGGLPQGVLNPKAGNMPGCREKSLIRVLMKVEDHQFGLTAKDELGLKKTGCFATEGIAFGHRSPRVGSTIERRASDQLVKSGEE